MSVLLRPRSSETEPPYYGYRLDRTPPQRDGLDGCPGAAGAVTGIDGVPEKCKGAKPRHGIIRASLARDEAPWREQAPAYRLRRRPLRRIHDARDTATIISNYNIIATVSWLRKDADENLYHESTYPQAAQTDLHDITRADFIVFLSEKPGNPFGLGGRHVELGYALALGRACIGIGQKENILHHFPKS